MDGVHGVTKMGVVTLQISFVNESEQKADVLRCLNTLYSTPVGTVALDREFGLDWTVLDLPLEIAKGRLTIDIIEKTRKYEPRVDVVKVLFSATELQAIDGTLMGEVVLKFV